MINIPREEMAAIFESSYDMFKSMFLGSTDRTALITFMEFVVDSLESRKDVCAKIFRNSESGESWFNNLHIPEHILMSTIFAEEKETAKELMLFFHDIKLLRQDASEENISASLTRGKDMLKKLGRKDDKDITIKNKS